MKKSGASDIPGAILLVEDEVILSMNEKRKLEAFGYEVLIAATGEEALGVFKEYEKIDLVLMDIELGAGIDGIETASAMLKHRDVPIIFLSNHSEPEIVERVKTITSYGYLGKNIDFRMLNASITGAINMHLQKNELEEFFMTSLDMLCIADMDGHFIRVNKEWENVLGYSINELQKRKFFEFVHPEDQQATLSAVKELGGKNKILNFVNRYLCKDGSYRSLEWRSTPVGKLIYAAARDITDRMKAEEELRKGKEKFQSFFNNAQVALFRTDLKNGSLIEINQRYASLAGYSDIETCMKEFNAADSWVDPDSRLELRRILEEQFYVNNYEAKIIRRDSSQIQILFSARIVPEEGIIEGSLIDITERNRFKQEIQRQLADKEILLKEVHHRVKNNIALIESLLSLQAASNDNTYVKIALREAITRIQSIRILYEKLLSGTEYEGLSVKNYIESLIDSIAAVFTEAEGIRIEKKIADISLSSTILKSIGIIINELLTNVFKYAFTEMEEGIVSVTLAMSDNYVTLSIKDNGVGINDSCDTDTTPGFGLSIVNILTEQLNGEFSMEKDGGMKSILGFHI